MERTVMFTVVGKEKKHENNVSSFTVFFISLDVLSGFHAVIYIKK